MAYYTPLFAVFPWLSSYPVCQALIDCSLPVDRLSENALPCELVPIRYDVAMDSSSLDRDNIQEHGGMKTVDCQLVDHIESDSYALCYWLS